MKNVWEMINVQDRAVDKLDMAEEKISETEGIRNRNCPKWNSKIKKYVIHKQATVSYTTALSNLLDVYAPKGI